MSDHTPIGDVEDDFDSNNVGDFDDEKVDEEDEDDDEENDDDDDETS